MSRFFIARTIATNFTTLGTGFITSILLARILGPGGRGEVAAAMLWPQMFVYLGAFGLIDASLYYTALSNSRTNAVFSNALILGLLQSLIIIPVGFFALPYLLTQQSTEVVSASRIFLLVIPISLISQYAISILQGKMHIAVYNVARLIIPVGYLVGIVILAVTRTLYLKEILYLQLGLNACVLLMVLFYVIRKGLVQNFQHDFHLMGRMIRYGTKVHLGTIAELGNLRLDQMLMAAFLPAHALGLYVTAVSATNVLRVIPNAVRRITTPIIASQKDNDYRIQHLQASLRKYWLLNLLLGLGLAILLPVAIPLIYGGAFDESILAAEILLLAAIFLGGKDLLTGVAQGFGRPELVSKSEVTALVVTVPSLALLLPWLGINGAALTTLFAYLSSLLVLIYGLYRSHDLPLMTLFWIDAENIRDLGSDLLLVTRRVKHQLGLYHV